MAPLKLTRMLMREISFPPPMPVTIDRSTDKSKTRYDDAMCHNTLGHRWNIHHIFRRTHSVSFRGSRFAPSRGP